MIGNDNSFFSIPIRPIKEGALPTDRVASCEEQYFQHAQDLPEDVLRYVDAATARCTRKAYHSDIRLFLTSGGAIPASPDSIARYLAAHATSLCPVTLARRLIAIGKAHASMGLPNPCLTDVVKATMRGIYRIHGRPARQVRPVLPHDITLMLPHMTGTRGLRDRALILVGFAGGLRRSELVALMYDDIEFVSDGFTLTIRRSKTDQSGAGRTIAIPFARSHACPVKAISAWLEQAAITGGPVFRMINKGGRIGKKPLSDQSVAQIVKRYTSRIGLNSTHYAGHSLRAGLITSAAQAGVSGWMIRQTTGHRSDAMLGRYIREADLFQRNAVHAVL